MPTLIPKIVGFALLFSTCGNAVAQVLFFDSLEQFGNGTALTSTSYTPASGPSSASVATSVQNGSPTITATNFLGSTWAFFDNSVVTNKNSYKGVLSAVQTNQQLKVTWRLWIQSTNTGPGLFLFSVPVQDANPSVTYNPPLVFLDTGSIVALTNGTSVQIPIGDWGSLAGTIMTNTLILDYPNGTFSYSLNGQTLATLPLGPYFTNVVGAIYFNGSERSVGSLGNRFAIDDVKVEMLTASAQPPPFQWARRAAGTINPDNELAIGLAMDSSANLYVTGWFDGTNDLGGVALTNKVGGGQDIFVAKYNSAGAPQWARRAGGNSAQRDGGRGIGVDAAGSVYVTGEFFGTADFGGFNLSAPQNKEFFIAKYDSAGTVQWARQSVGGRSFGVYGTGLAVDAAGNSYAVGFTDNGTTVTFGTTNLTSAYFTGYGTFLVKYDNAGDVKWAQLFDSPDQTYSTAVTLDGNGNVYVGGSFRSSVSFGATSFTNAGDEDAFVAKFNSAGVLQWARQAGGLSSAGVESLSADSSGSLYIAGGFGNAAGDTITFGPSITLTNIGGGILGAGVGDAFLAKYDASTGTAQWARRFGGTNLDAYTGVVTDSHGNVYVGGASGGTGLPGGFNAVVTRYDANGVARWTQSSTGTNGALVFAGPVVDVAGNCYVGGWFQTNAVFGATTLTGRGYWDFFLAKVGFAPLTLGIEWSNSLPRLRVSGDIGTRFALEYVPALAATNSWNGLITNTVTTSPLIHTDTNPVSSSRFYRARLVP